MPKLEPLIKVYIGIDPGATGGIAYFDPFNGGLTAIAMPDTLTDIWEALQLTGIYNVPRYAIIEWINPAYMQTAKSSNSKLYGNFLALQAFCIAAGISFEIHMPAKWQAKLGMPKSGGDYAAHKKRLKERAQQMFPNMKVKKSTADAILIAEYCRRFHLGLL